VLAAGDRLLWSRVALTALLNLKANVSQTAFPGEDAPQACPRRWIR